MKNWLKALAVATLSGALLSACGDDNDTPPAVAAPPGSAKLRIVHASPDAPKVNVLAGGTALVSNLDFAAISPLASVTEGSASVEIKALVPGGQSTVFGPATLNFARDKIYSAIAVGNAASLAVEVFAIDDTAVTAGRTRLTVFHGAAAAPGVDVYLTAPAADLASATAVGTFSFKQKIGPAEVANGDYRIRVTPAGARSPVIYDSGTVTLAGGDLFLAAVPSPLAAKFGSGYAPIQLILSSGSGPATVLHDTATPAALRVVHASPDTPAVDVVVNGNFAQPLVDDLAFPAFTPYVQVPAASYNVKVAAAADNSVVPINADLTLARGTVSSVLAVGPLASVAPLVLSDDVRRIATEARVRIVHAAPSAPNVDVFVTAPGAGIASATPVLSNVPFKAASDYLSLAAGNYDVAVAPTGTRTPAIGPVGISVSNGKTYTAIARDSAGGGAPFGLILMDDFQAN